MPIALTWSSILNAARSTSVAYLALFSGRCPCTLRIVWMRLRCTGWSAPYTAWDAAEPGKGYDAKAAEWGARLDPARPEPAAPVDAAKQSTK